MINGGDYMKFESFCAANSGLGFISFFDTLLNEKKHKVYYIKGGPGSGKSTFMKEIAKSADHAELILCSGDPSSIDGVILPKENAVVIDATKPHSHEPKYPGVGGNILDLGIGWDSKKLDKEKIIALSDQKSKVYENCYNLLQSALCLKNNIFTALAQQIDQVKLEYIGDKILRQNALWEQAGKEAVVKNRFLSCISPDGMFTLSATFEKLGKHFIILEDRWQISHILLSYLDRQLTKRGIDHINSYHPLAGKKTLQHIIIPQANLSIISKDSVFCQDLPEENIIRKINLQTLLEKEYLESNKNKLNFIKRLEKEILLLAVDKLAEARFIHMEIEKEYAQGMNHTATQPLKENLINNLFGKT